MTNRKKTYPLYKAENLTVRRRRRRRPPEREPLRPVVPTRRSQRWSMGFASDALWTGRRFRCLCLVDDATRESPALLTDVSIAGERVPDRSRREALAKMGRFAAYTGPVMLGLLGTTKARALVPAPDGPAPEPAPY